MHPSNNFILKAIAASLLQERGKAASCMVGRTAVLYDFELHTEMHTQYFF